MKLIIAGGRDYELTDTDFGRLDVLMVLNDITEVVSGGAKGADAGGEEWARRNHLPITHFFPDWKLNGRAAGPIRNRQMAEYADGVVLFPGGRGTQNMFDEAMKMDGFRIWDWRQ